MSEPIRITAQPTTDPAVCNFIADRPFLPMGSASCSDPKNAMENPLFAPLFRLPGIRNVLFTGNQVTIAKTGDEDWQRLGKEIGNILRKLLATPSFTSPPVTAKSKLPHENDVEAIEKILREKINPGLASHGGQVTLEKFEKGKAYLKFGGGCHGCGMISVTLKQGIDETLRKEIPSVREVIDITDHAAGEKPYY